jgi:DNA polymerase I-like protein with 3'-5' exonuclease and polymerase domains
VYFLEATMKVAFDFESKGIEPFPNYPPKPTMLGIYVEGLEPGYMSWGHPSGNNCTEEEAKEVLKQLWDSSDVELVTQNLSFDLAIASRHWGFPLQREGKFHDTMVMAFLLDPHAKTYSLKPSAEKHLGLLPSEQDEVRDWLVANGVVRANAKDWGTHISECPAEIVGPYCVGDVVRTMQLMNEAYMPKVLEQGMLAAYEREMALIPIMLENTLDGIVVDVARLTTDCELYQTAIDDVSRLLFQELGCEPFNIDSDEQLADAIDAKHPDLVWAKTATGKRSTSKANMEETLSGIGGKLGAILQYFASVSTCLNTFMKPWLLQATTGDGRVRCQWNTTRSDKGGARTGRLSSTPSLMNIPTLSSAKFAHAIQLHKEFLPQLPRLPDVRRYILPDDDDSVIVSLDYNSQELRVLGHMAGGLIRMLYQNDPNVDIHQTVADIITKELGMPFPRKFAKTVGFSVLYGSGLTALAAGLGVNNSKAAEIKGAYYEVLPGIPKIQGILKRRARDKMPITTWGGRKYYCEEPYFSTKENRWLTFDYKLLNYLIQGSSADITKSAIIEYNKRKVYGRFLLTVHDQIVISVKKWLWLEEALILKKAMESQPLDAPLIADISFGPNLHDLTDFKPTT